MLALRNRLAAISGFVAPSAASRATRSSWGVRVFRVSSSRLRGCLSRRGQLAAGTLSEPVQTHGVEEVDGGPEVLTRVATLLATPEFLAVEKVRASDVTGSVRLRPDRWLPHTASSHLRRREERAAPSEHTLLHRVRAGLDEHRVVAQGRLCYIALATSGGGFDKVGQRDPGDVLTGLADCIRTIASR